jgi:hypothetical protein
MKTTKKSKTIAADDAGIIYTDFPKTHIFYEYQGERAVDPMRLALDGITLWREQADDNIEHRSEVLRLWDEAEALLAKPHDTPSHSYIEWLRYRVTIGSLDPKKWQGWKRGKPYPYRGMLISAIYFQEALRLCEVGKSDRAWHIIAMAYYHLGMNTTPSSTQMAAKAAKTRHANAVEMRRALALVLVESIIEQQKKKRTINSIEGAINEVIRIIHANPKLMAELEQVDALTSPKVIKDKDSDALTRFGNLLSEWTAPNSPHPDIAEAYSFFSQRKFSPRTKSTGPAIPTSALDPDLTHYMRLVNYIEEGFIFTLEISRSKEATEEEEAD